MRVRYLHLETLCQSPLCFVDSISVTSISVLSASMVYFRILKNTFNKKGKLSKGKIIIGLKKKLSGFE